MAKNRKAPKAAPAGVAWPADGSGGHSTTPTAQKILGASLDAVKLESPVGQSSKAWRFGYVKHFTNAVTGMAGRSSDTVAMAQAGLAAAHSAFEFTRDGKTTALADAMDGKTFPGTFQTGPPRPPRPALSDQSLRLAACLRAHIAASTRAAPPAARFRSARAQFSMTAAPALTLPALLSPQG